MLGAHFDSHPFATGATDNATGSAGDARGAPDHQDARSEAAPDDPRRRSGAAKNRGCSAPAPTCSRTSRDPQTMALKPEHAKLAAYFNLDNGTGKIRGIWMQSNLAVRPIFEQWVAPLKDLGVTILGPSTSRRPTTRRSTPSGCPASSSSRTASSTTRGPTTRTWTPTIACSGTTSSSRRPSPRCSPTTPRCATRSCRARRCLVHRQAAEPGREQGAKAADQAEQIARGSRPRITAADHADHANQANQRALVIPRILFVSEDSDRIDAPGASGRRPRRDRRRRASTISDDARREGRRRRGQERGRGGAERVSCSDQRSGLPDCHDRGSRRPQKVASLLRKSQTP